MLTVVTRIKIVVFAVIAVLVVGYIGVTYADLGRYVGMRGYYTVRLDLATAGGLFEGSAVSYRGVTVGKVGTLDLSRDGVIAELRIDDSSPKIPGNLQAVVANRSAVGEQYVDLRPAADSGPYLAQGSTIPRSVTVTPAPVNETLKSVNDLAASLPLDDTKVLIDELGLAFAGQGPHLQQLLDTSARFVSASDAAFPDSRALIHNGRAVLRTQNEMSAAFKAFASSSSLLARQLRDSDTDLRRLIAAGPGAANELSGLLRDLDPSLSVLLANLLTTARVGEPRQAAIEELLANLPNVAGVGSSIVSGGKLRLGLVNTFFNPQPCTRGYGKTRYRNGLDLSPAPGFNTGAHCAESPSTGINVRGAANAPREGVPAPAKPGTLSGAGTTDLLNSLGLTGLARPAPSGDLAALLGLGGPR
ncbi:MULTISPECIES: MCE family protein [Actinomadura]|uniref:MCE family protein n=1 Tax=Actinomadura TaxID=1988 RepID=UPI0003AD5FC9|nr:MlaD family protein [Actinomadura madurae]SPT58913.1 virulence factor Mce family protein [Actinomadura madurae]